jgi:hypothetical protein
LMIVWVTMLIPRCDPAFAQVTTVQSFKSPLAIIYGGTGKTTVTANSYVKGNGTSALVERTYSEVRTDLGLATTDTPLFAGLTLTGYSGFCKATAGAFSCAALVDADIPNDITLTNITQITNRSHTSLTDIGTLSHSTIDGYLDGYVPKHTSDAVGLENSPIQISGTRVGIGAVPDAMFLVDAGSGGPYSGIALRLSSESVGAVARYTGIDFHSYTSGLVGQFFLTGDTYYNSGANLPPNSIGLFTEHEDGSLVLYSAGTSGDIRLGTGGYDLTNERVRILSNGNFGINTKVPSETLDVKGNIKYSGTTGGSVTKTSEATCTTTAATTCVITLNIPSGVRLLGAQLRVDTALTAGDTWGAAYSGGSTTVIAAAGQAVAKDTKVNKLHVDEITSNTTNITITRDAGSFTAGGVIRGIVYYMTVEAMADAA